MLRDRYEPLDLFTLVPTLDMAVNYPHLNAGACPWRFRQGAGIRDGRRVDRPPDADRYTEGVTVLGRDVPGPDEVAMQRVVTRTTDEQGTGPPVVARRVPTARAGVARVSRLDTDHRATARRGFVLDEDRSWANDQPWTRRACFPRRDLTRARMPVRCSTTIVAPGTVPRTMRVLRP